MWWIYGIVAYVVLGVLVVPAAWALALRDRRNSGGN